jgi:hypothetical protein
MEWDQRAWSALTVKAADRRFISVVITGLVPVIHAALPIPLFSKLFLRHRVDGRVKPGQDEDVPKKVLLFAL